MSITAQLRNVMMDVVELEYQSSQVVNELEYRNAQLQDKVEELTARVLEISSKYQELSLEA